MKPGQLLQNLLKLHSLEYSEGEPDDAGQGKLKKAIADLRLQIPSPILSHYDRLGARGKRALAPVRNQTCAGCHMRVTRAVVVNLMRGEDIQVCENCGRYLYLPESDAPEAPVLKTAKRSPRKANTLAELPIAA